MPSNNNSSTSSAVDIPRTRQSVSLSNRVLRQPTLPQGDEEIDSNIHRGSDISIPQDRVLKNGWLYKRGRSKTWKRYWFVLRDHQLTWYKDEKEYKPKEVIHTADIMSASMVTDHLKEKNHFAVYTSSHSHHFRADNDPDAQDWVDVIKHMADAAAESLLSSSFKRMGGLSSPIAIANRAEEHRLMVNSPQGIAFPHNFSSGGALQAGVFSAGSASCFEFSGTEAVSSVGSPDDDTRHQDYHHHRLHDSSMPRSATPEDEKVIKKGYMLRLKRRLNKWKKQYVVLTTQRVLFAKSEQQLENPVKVVPISSIADVVDIDPLSKTKIYCMQIITPEKRLRFCLDSEESLTSWLASLKSVITARRGSGGLITQPKLHPTNSNSATNSANVNSNKGLPLASPRQNHSHNHSHSQHPSTSTPPVVAPTTSPPQPLQVL